MSAHVHVQHVLGTLIQVGCMYLLKHVRLQQAC